MSRALAAPICFVRRGLLDAPSQVAEHLLRVNTYGKADRKTAGEFAKDNNTTTQEVVDRYAGSGNLLCADYGSQAQLVIKDNVVLVANHGLPGSPCIDEKALSKCKVTFNENGKPKDYRIKRLLKGGMTCKPGFENMHSEDWAVVELESRVNPKVKPYQIANAPCASNEKPVDVVAVGKSIDVGPAPAKGWAFWTKHYGNCQLRLGDCGQRFPALRSDCDTSGGSSGGGMFIGGADPKLIGIVSGGGRSCEKPHPLDHGDYDEFCWNSVYVPVGGELKTLLNSIDDQAKPKDQPNLKIEAPSPTRPSKGPIQTQDL